MGAGGKALQGELVAAAMFAAPAPLVDVGVNLVDPSFAKDRLGVLQRARAAGVAAIVVTGCTVKSARAARDLCDAPHAALRGNDDEAEAEAGAGPPPLPQLFFTAGVHPHNAKDCTDATLGELRELAAHERCVAIGECGLDFNRNFSPPDVQERWFAAQVRLALELRKPLFMHCRDAGARFAEILAAEGFRGGGSGVGAGEGGAEGEGQGVAVAAAGGAGAGAGGEPGTHRGVLHCFTGSADELRQCLDLGLCIGVTGWVCDERPERGGAELAALLPSVPAGRLMIETDAPYLVPRTIVPNKARPGRNEPALLPHVLRAVAAARGESEAQVAAATTATARAFFGLPAVAER